MPDIDAEVRYDWLGAYGWFYGLNTSSANDELTETVDQCVDTYNAGVQELVAKKQAEGKNVQFADIHGVVDKKNGLIDGVHPNETGYAAMGLLWANTISSYLNGSPVVTTTTTTETTTTTTETTTAETTTTTTETTTSETTTTTAETESTTTETTTTATETTTSEAVTTTATSDIPSSIPGDVIPDGRINAFDLAGMKMSIYLPHPDVYPFQGPEDYNQDGSFNMTDIVALAKYLVGAK